MTTASHSVRAIWIAAVASFACLLIAGSASAATITPNTFADQFNAGAECSLREAVEAANTDAAFGGCTAGSGADTIPLAAGTYQLSLPGNTDDLNTTGDLDIPAGSAVTISNPTGKAAAIDGGGVDRVLHLTSTGSAATLSGVTIQNGQTASGAGGGGVRVIQGVLLMTDSTVTNNSTARFGGGILAFSGGNTRVTLTNVTISGNRSTEEGGGVALYSGEMRLNNVTVAGNTSDLNGGGLDVNGGLLGISNTIVAGNTDTAAPLAPDCAGTFPSGGNNLIGNTTGCTFGPAAGDILGSDPLLGALADNGGPTFTRALSKGSPAIGGAGPGAAPTDQRGVPRSSDIGAYEFARCGKVVVNRVGTSGKDKLTGTSKADGILGLDGKDVLKGLKGKDGLCGGNGKDKLKGGGGKDKLIGGKGNDKLSGGGGNDSCKGGKGKDKLASC